MRWPMAPMKWLMRLEGNHVDWLEVVGGIVKLLSLLLIAAVCE